VNPGRPSALITIDGRQLNAAQAALVSLRIVAAASTHDVAELAFWPQTKFTSASVGSSIAIKLGVVDSEEDVLSGTIGTVAQEPAALLLQATASTSQLSATRKSQTYLSSSVADIVKDLAGSVTVDDVQADLQLEAYSIDTRRTVWGHLVDLARLCGAVVGAGTQGGLRFVPLSAGSADYTFRFGADLLSWRAAQCQPFGAPGIAPHGAASEQGSSRWHWVLHDPLGPGASPSRIIGAFHSRDAADQYQSALAGRAASSGVRGEVKVVGEPRVRPGELVKLGSLPGGDPGLLRVVEVRHQLDMRGFSTSLMVEGAGGGGGGLPSVSL